MNSARMAGPVIELRFLEEEKAESLTNGAM